MADPSWAETESRKLCGCQDCTHLPPRRCDWQWELEAMARSALRRAIQECRSVMNSEEAAQRIEALMGGDCG